MFRKLLLCAMFAVTSSVWAQTEENKSMAVVDLPTRAGSELHSGCIYKVRDPKTEIISTTSNKSALSVEAGKTAIIYIPAGVTLTVKGDYGSSAFPGTPGINVPEGSTLIVTGEGTLIAEGGACGSGNDGLTGEGGWRNGEHAYAGKGGTGGAGGWGGAPGIGGYGGSGATANPGPSGPDKTCSGGSSFDTNGNDGYATKSGGNGSGMGTVYILGTVKVKATAGSVPSYSSGINGDYRSAYNYYSASWSLYYYCYAGGGPGGGGGSGYTAPYGIGGGGAGGQSGASGGSGGLMKKTGGTHYLHGGGGKGGLGGKEGKSSTMERGKWTQVGWDDRLGGDGGRQTFNTAVSGNAGTLYAANSNNLTIVPDGRSISSATSHRDIEFTVTLINESSSAGTAVTVTYGVMPKDVTPPTKEGSFFTGYFTASGERLYDAYGHPFGIWTIPNDVVLYAGWSSSHISTVEQFEKFCDIVNSSSDSKNIHAYLDADIDLTQSKNSKSIGTEANPFKGTFEGQFHTLKVAVTPFPYLQGATLSNLVVEGNAKTSGLVYKTTGGSSVTTTLSCVEVRTNVSQETGANTSGIVNAAEGKTVLNNCSYTGCMTSSGDMYGICCSAPGTLTLNRCLVALADASSSNTFHALCGSGTAQGQNTCYALNRSNINADGANVVDRTKLSGGEVCYLLNGKSTNGVWYQNIDGDQYIPFPSVFSTDVEHAIWLRIHNGRVNNYVIYADGGENLHSRETTGAEDELFALVGDENSFKLYSKTKKVYFGSADTNTGTPVVAGGAKNTFKLKISTEQGCSGYDIVPVENENVSFNMYGSKGRDIKYHTFGTAWNASVGNADNNSESSLPTICHTARKVFMDNNQYHNRNSIRFKNGAEMSTHYAANNETEVYADFTTYDISREASPLLASEEKTSDACFAAGMNKDSVFYSASGTTDIQHTQKLNPYNAYSLYMGRGKHYLDMLPNTDGKHVWEYSGAQPKSFQDNDSLYIGGNNYVYSFLIMQGGTLMHNFTPARHNGSTGMYDIVTGKFASANTNAELYINTDECQHTYAVREHGDGMDYDHCNICDMRFNITYYAVVRYEKNDMVPKSKVAGYNQVAGTMADQPFTAPDKLKACLYTRPMHVFKGWNTKPDGTGTAFAD